MSYRLSTDRQDPTKGAYNGFSLKDRGASWAWAMTVKDFPKWPPKGSACMVCGQTEGQISWHNEDYRTPVDALIVCGWCHWALHSRIKPRQAHVWPVWVAKLRAGHQPPPCKSGTRWATWAAKYLRTPPEWWDWNVDGEAYDHPLRDLLDTVAHERVPPALALCEGAPHLPGQFNSREAQGTLQVFTGFDPPLGW